MDSRIYLYAHGGSGNHGCEAIVRSTTKLLREKNIALISSAPEEDKYYGIDKLCRIVSDKSERIPYLSWDFIKAYFALKVHHDYVPMDKLWYKESFASIRRGDIALSIGGDNYCYADVHKYVMLQDMLKKRGAKTVLWGCSVEPQVARVPEIAADLARYDLITARETISYEVLKKINSNTVLVADPAFLLRSAECELPKGFQRKNMVGINVSPMVINNENSEGITVQNYEALIEMILQETDMGIALIPHVIWKDGDDRIPLKKLYDKYAECGRVILVNDRTCEEIKYVISQCRFFVGARTHATIAAYSSCVPTLVLGYSVKARGIARDLFGEEDNYIISVQQLRERNDLAKKFRWMIQQEKEIVDRLQNTIPMFIQRAENATEGINGLLKGDVTCQD